MKAPGEKCKLVRYLQCGNSLEKRFYDCGEVRLLHESWKKDFEEANQTYAVQAAGLKDLSYENFCNEIDSFLSNCKCHTGD